MSPVLFLDIDGVLNSSRTCAAFGKYPLNIGELRRLCDPIALGLIQKLRTRIVLSSTWRIQYDYKEIGQALDLKIIDKTPCFGKRGEEIQRWMDENPQLFTTYAIVDDDNDMLPSQQPYFVRTDYHEGLTFGNYSRLRDLLR